MSEEKDFQKRMMLLITEDIKDLKKLGEALSLKEIGMNTLGITNLMFVHSENLLANLNVWSVYLARKKAGIELELGTSEEGLPIMSEKNFYGKKEKEQNYIR